ncbi:tripartite tricarboxylate transporter TctB family protein [Faunimonas sp. B44]|uniref:tripartite tricarboxylate transporter TctB family protein n=1 Tax=Faunimonas sp. B44 TaxID=3461493 RepID=UPI0040446274
MNRPLEALASPAAGRRWRTLALHAGTPILLVVAALVLPAFMLNTSRPFRGSGLGPAAWPHFMLWLVAACAALWAVQSALAWRSGALDAPAPPAEETEQYSYDKAVAGLALILAYGWSLPRIGFPLATAAFIAIWCVLGGVRNPLAVIPVSVLGTITLLWVFMGLALMPLSRGTGVFDGISIAILRALGIY